MKLKLSCLLSVCILMGSCSGGTSDRVVTNPINTSSGASAIPSGICPNGNVINPLTQSCPIGQTGANQVANAIVDNKTTSSANAQCSFAGYTGYSSILGGCYPPK
jgi:hypothetical protein